MDKRIFLSLFILAMTANAQTKPAVVPVIITPPPPEIIKEEKKKPVKTPKADALTKVERILDGCDTNKKKCVYKLKELRATVTDPKILKRIDEALKSLK